MSAPPGPVMVNAKTNDNNTGLFGTLMSNWPLLAGSVRSTTLGTPGSTVPNVTPRTPVTVTGLPWACSVAPSSNAPNTIVNSRFMICAAPCDSAGRGICIPCRRAISSTPLFVRLVDHRHDHGARVDTRRLVRRRLHLGTHPHPQCASAVQARSRATRRSEGDAAGLRVVLRMHARVAHDRHGVTGRTERRGKGERHGHRAVGLARHVEPAGIGQVGRRDRLVHAREDVPEVQLLGA